MGKLPIVALIGQTNVGKSSLLNRMARRNIAIVAREAGTTRDNVVTRIDNKFVLVDTAGLKDPEDEFESNIQDQITDAVETADLILLTLDSSKYPDQYDKQIARTALKSRKPVFLLLNKADLGEALPHVEFIHLGIRPENTFRVSATTGKGVGELVKAIEKNLGRHTSGNVKNLATEDENSLKLALIGRPNVGKSSLFNQLGQKQQALVSSYQGTTRDVNRVNVKYHGKNLEILDTAGLRRPGKQEVGIEKFSALRTLAAIEEADICALLVDATEPHAKLDQTLAGKIVDAGKGIIVVLTKTDLVEDLDPIIDELSRDFDFLTYAPLVFISNVTGQNVTKIFELAMKIDQTRRIEIKTSELNKILGEAVIEHTPAGLKNTRPKLRYIVQTDTCPPWFVVYGRQIGLLHWSYKRFLERKIREKYPFIGTPIFISYREDKDQEK